MYDDDPLRSSTYPPEREFLVDCVSECPGEYVIEVGSFYGSTTVQLADAASRCGKRVIAIDPWSGYYSADETVYQSFLGRIQPWSDHITVCRLGSQDVEIQKHWLGNAALVFIDGDHDRDAPYLDIIKFWPCVSNGGILAVHDYYDARHWRFVQHAVQRFIDRLPKPQTLQLMRYYPTDDELRAHGAKEGQAGIAWLRKESSIN